MACSRGGVPAALAYTVIVLGPLVLGSVEHVPGRGFWVNFSVALGFVALSVLGLQALVGAHLPSLTSRFGSGALSRYHRQMSLLAVAGAVGHPLILFLVDDRYRVLLDVLHAPLRARLAWLAVTGLLLLVVTSVWRRVLRLPYPAWHVLHSLLATTVVAAALGHAFLVDHYMAEPLVRGAWLGYGGLFAWLAIYIRLIRPLLLWRRPWRITALHPEPGGSLTLTLRPVNARHGRLNHTFAPGQFAWLMTGRNPFALTYYPFSLSSSADDRGQVQFTVKQVGRFTESLLRLKVGDRLFLDGPHGAFTLDRTPGPGFVFLGAGVGVTPFLSMLSTLADRRDKRPCLLLLGNRSEMSITGVRQLHGLAHRLDLTVVHVISQASPGWTGERGRIGADLLKFYLPADYQALEFYVCASPRVADSYRRALKELGVAASHIHSEEFSAV